MPAPIGLQLYSLRESMNQDFQATIEKVAQIGYSGVEIASLPGITPKEAKKLFDSLGLTVCGTHSQLPLDDKKKDIIETMGILGNPPLIIPWQPPESFESLDRIKRLAEILNKTNEIAKVNGFKIGYHNHHAEMNRIDGKPGLLILSELTHDDIFFEVDTYWAQTGGVDPVSLIKSLGRRAPFLHLKDGPCVRGEPMTAVGDGIMEFKPIIDAGEEFTKWSIVEIDSCATDMLEAVEKSYQFITNKGFAYGRT